MIPRAHRLSVTVLSFPRVSGDEPCSTGPTWDPKTFSPRERG